MLERSRIGMEFKFDCFWCLNLVVVQGGRDRWEVGPVDGECIVDEITIYIYFRFTDRGARRGGLDMGCRLSIVISVCL